MLRIELSALSAQELKRLLDQARARNQPALVEQLLAELEARPGRMEDWRAEPRAMSWTPTYEDDFLDPEPLAAPPRRSGVMAATAAIAAVVSAAVTWGISVPPAPSPVSPASPPRAAVILASVAPVGPATAPARSTVAQPAPAATTPSPPPARAASATARDNPCYDLPTAAERLVCGYPSLANRDRQMRQAVDRLRAMGSDPRALDVEQSTFEGASRDVTDHKALADLYDRRLRELSDATARIRASEPLF